MRPKPGSVPYSILRWNENELTSESDAVTAEEPLQIRVNGEAIAVTMRTPGHDEELATGFCVTEGIFTDADDLVSAVTCDDSVEDNTVDVTIEHEDASAGSTSIERARRTLYLSSSCGVCGKQSLDRIEQLVKPFSPKPAEISLALLSGLPTKLRRVQEVFARTGGLHSAGLFDTSGKLLVQREDIGRHNAVDKVVGHCLLQRLSEYREHAILLVSGRSSFEIVQKAAVARIPTVAAVSAPSTLAIDLARRLDMTLVGFLRRGRLNIYNDPGRIEDVSDKHKN